MLKSNIDWLFWGKTDPFYGVAAVANKNRRGSDPWTEEDFYHFSEPDLTVIRRHWEHYGVNYDSCLEIGCGVGRMTLLLNRVFERLFGIDVSEDMLEIARKHVKAEFLLSDGEHIPLPRESVSAAFSLIVFQHLDTEADGLNYLKEIFDVLKPGGTIMLNIPTHHFPSRLSERAYSFKLLAKGTKARLHRTATRIPIERLRRKFGAYMHSTTYDLKHLFEAAAVAGFVDIEMRLFRLPITDSDRHLHFLFGTKPR